MEELARLAFAAALAAALVLTAFTLRWALYWLWRTSQATAGDLASRYALAPGRPGILFIVEDGCNQCTALQEPVLAAVAARAGAAVRRLAASEARDLVQRFGIATFPATVVIDRHRALRGVNFGFADAETLTAQAG